jgi:hypothetical protein
MDQSDRSGSALWTRRFGNAVAALATLTLLTACEPGSPGPSSPSTTPPVTATPTPTVTAVPSPTPEPIETPTPAALGWPRDGWTLQTGLSVGLGSIALYFPNSWSFDTNESGLWWDGTYHVFCDPYVDHTLNNPGAPNAETLATTQWNLIGYPPVANQQGFTTFYGYEGWRGDVTGMKGTEHRAYVIVGDVWIQCGAITRETAASGDELWDIVDSIQIVDESSMQMKAWNSN